jgi:hypothetical protein
MPNPYLLKIDFFKDNLTVPLPKIEGYYITIIRSGGLTSRELQFSLEHWYNKNQEELLETILKLRRESSLNYFNDQLSLQFSADAKEAFGEENVTDLEYLLTIHNKRYQKNTTTPTVPK